MSDRHIPHSIWLKLPGRPRLVLASRLARTDAAHQAAILSFFCEVPGCRLWKYLDFAVCWDHLTPDDHRRIDTEKLHRHIMHDLLDDHE